MPSASYLESPCFRPGPEDGSGGRSARFCATVLGAALFSGFFSGLFCVGSLRAAETVFDAIAAKDTAAAEALIVADPTLLNQRNPMSHTPLQVAAARNNAALAAWLIDRGADLEAADGNQVTAVQLAAQNNSVECLQLLIAKGANLHARDKNKRDALGAASSHPWKASVDLIREAEATDTPPGAAPVITEAFIGFMTTNDVAQMKSAVTQFPEMVYGRGEHHRTSLILAAMQHRPEQIQLLLDAGSVVDATDDEGETALQRAVEIDAATCVKILLTKNPDLTRRDKQGRTVLELAQSRQNNDLIPLLQGGATGAEAPPSPPPAPAPKLIAPKEVIDLVIGNQVDKLKAALDQNPALARAWDNDGFPLIVQAAGCGYDRMLGVFLDAGADVDAVDKEGFTSLHRAAKNGQMACVKLLVERGANVYIKDHLFNATAEQMAAGKHPDIGDYLKGVAAGTINVGGPAGLIKAIVRGDLPTVKSLLAQTPALALQPDATGRTPLHFAMLSKSEIAAYLMTQKADVNKGDLENWRPIHIAAEAGRADMVKLLLQNEADPNPAATASAQTPLYIAAVYGFTEVAKDLLEAHANPNLDNNRGVSPLHRSAECGYIDIVSLLILAKADVNAKDQTGKTPLDYAITAHQPAVIALLQKYGATGTLPVPAEPVPGVAPVANPTGPEGAPGGVKADPTAKLDPDQEKAFMDACGRCDLAKITELLKADPNLAYSKDGSGYNGLHYLGMSGPRGTPEMALKLLDLGVPIDVKNGWGRTPLLRAAEGGDDALVELYLQHGAAVDSKDEGGWTPLWAASQAGDSEHFVRVVNILLDHKADATLKDADHHETPYAAAKRTGHTAVLQALVAHGIKE